MVATGVLFVVTLLTLFAYNGANVRATEAEARANVGANTGDLEAREADLDAREAALDERESDPPGGYTEVVTDGVYVVGESVPPGVYRTEQVGEYCQWHIIPTGSGIYDGDIINFGAGEPGPIQVTLRDGQDFTSSDCGSWTRVG